MRVNKIFYYIILLFIGSPFFSYAQESSEKLEDNVEYANYKLQLDSLQKAQSDIIVEIDRYKALIESDPERKDEYVNEVLRIEGQLFDLRSKVGIVSSKCGAIEQEYIIRNMGKRESGAEGSASASKNLSQTNLLLSKFFTDNITPQEMEHIKKDIDIDSLAMSLIDSMRKEVGVLSTVNDELRRTQDALLADSLYAVAERSLDAIAGYEASLKDNWADEFDTKIYVYTRLMDKLNISLSVLSQMSGKVRDVRSAKEAADGVRMSPVFYAFAKERELVLSYEKILAEKLVYLSAIDSLNRKLDFVKAIHFEEPEVEIPEWDYVRFSNVAIGGAGVHTAQNPIGKVMIPTYGSVYMLRFAVLTAKPKQLSVFKGANPVSEFQNETGRYEYYCGMYKTKDEAQEDASVLRKIGFSPIVVQWREGGKVASDGTIIPVNVYDSSYRLEFDSVTPELTAKLRELAPDKELMKIDDKYSIGFFRNYLDVIKIQKTIGVECKIIPVDIN